MLETYENGAIVSSLEGANVKFDTETGRWSAPKSIVRHFDGEKETFTNTQPLDTVINLRLNELGRMQDVVTTMNISELGQFIKQQKAKGSDMVPHFEVEWHKRFSAPFSTFILTLIGVSLSSRKVRGGTGLHIGMGIVLCFSFILFQQVYRRICQRWPGSRRGLRCGFPISSTPLSPFTSTARRRSSLPLSPVFSLALIPTSLLFSTD